VGVVNHRPRRRFRRPPYRTLIVVVGLIALAVARYFAGPLEPSPANLPSEGLYHVVRVVDGDTLIVEPHLTVRLIGVNTPETVKPEHPVEPWGPEASEFTREFLASGIAQLQFDRERVDQYGRYLAYVWVDGRMLNEELVRAGLGRYEPQYRYSEAIKRRLREAQRQAQRQGLGIWSREPAR
jgi:micrococcal nuclease